ncbi:MAG: cytochrome C biogenesis protein [Armatimonadota bacterium]|nr:cytochrome C biogenesis protein [Armatimonadota bacterium]MDR7426484.1 cytochrome C biogenesis protein [Armatimonadota bacterium]MDR7463381.1 cytochrome C biogenesis protein [Armatimonadota bacterium]MDR7468564.1 cytochrome C biogenesis protein [Armatimonadota bacterium]MDR7475157.1 cytochrome C biogenesis protein [Armatimonadota bacterium]
MSRLSFPTVIVSGLLDGLNPCAFGVVLSLVALLLAGIALGEARPRLWRVGGAYVAGMFLTYLLLGLGVISVVAVLTRTHLPVRIMGLLVVILGLWMLKDAFLPGTGWRLEMPAAFHGSVRKMLAQTTPVGLFAAGGLVGLCTVPCSGAIYMGVLALLARQPFLPRLGYLLAYNVMFVLPLLALLVVVASRRTLNRIAHWYVPRKSLARAVLGTLTLILGFVVLVTA